MERSKLRKLMAAGSAAAVLGIALALAGPSIGSAPPDDGTPGSCTDFARDVDPKQIPVDSGYDADNDVVYAHTAGRTYVLRPSDPACRTLAGVRAVMDDAVQADRENQEVTCRALRDSVEQDRSDARGRSFDRAAADRYLAERCAGS